MLGNKTGYPLSSTAFSPPQLYDILILLQRSIDIFVKKINPQLLSAILCLESVWLVIQENTHSFFNSKYTKYSIDEKAGCFF